MNRFHILPSNIKLTPFQCLLIRAVRRGGKRNTFGSAYGKVARVFTTRYKHFLTEIDLKSDADYINKKYEEQTFHTPLKSWSSGNQVLGKELCEYAKSYFNDDEDWA